jgi:ubiquitin C-terminal hydrolase
MKQRCEACGERDPDKHHIKSRGAGGSDDEFNILYLCRHCHTEIHAIGPKNFCDKFPHIEVLLEDRGYVLIQEFGRWRLSRKSIFESRE